MRTMHWVVVADEARARFFAGEALDDLVELQSLIHPEGQMKDRDLHSDRPGRYAAGGSSGDARADAQAVEAKRFAAKVADVLRVGRNEGKYDRVVIVAPARFLGRVRAALDSQVARVVVGEIDKDLSRIAIHELPAALRRSLPPTAGFE